MSFRFVFKHEIGRLSSPSFVATSVAVPQLDILDLQGVAPVLRSQNVNSSPLIDSPVEKGVPHNIWRQKSSSRKNPTRRGVALGSLSVALPETYIEAGSSLMPRGSTLSTRKTIKLHGFLKMYGRH